MARTKAAPCRRLTRVSAAKVLALGCVLAGLLCSQASAQSCSASASSTETSVASDAVEGTATPGGSVHRSVTVTPGRSGEGELSSGGSRAAPQLFGTVSFRMAMKKQQNWLDAMRRHAEAPIFFDERALSRSVTWGQLRTRLEGRPLREQLHEVNRFWNAWPYRSDREVWGKEDYWASPAEFLARSGDCEDYCIAKYFTLRQLGVPADSMRIVVVKETIRGISHAVLAVFEGQDVHILDNLSDSVRPMRRVRNYVPHVSVNENGRWMHVKARPVKAARSGEKGHGTQ